MQLGEHFFTLCEFCSVCQAFIGLSFGYHAKLSQKIVEIAQFKQARQWQITRFPLRLPC
jgi:hypothetical protein